MELKQKLAPVLQRLARDSILPRAEQLMENANYNYPLGFDEAVAEVVKAGGILMIISNHQAHTDIYSGFGVINQISEILLQRGLNAPKFHIPGAASMWSGHQGLVIKVLNDAMCKRLNEDDIYPFPVARTKEREKFGLAPNLKELIKALRDMERNKSGMLIYPEASMNPGRTRWKFPFNKPPFCTIPAIMDSIIGMVEPADHLVDSTVGFLDKKGIDTHIIKMSTHGAYRVQSPNYGAPTPQALLALYTGYKMTPIEVFVQLPENVKSIRERLAADPTLSLDPYPIENLMLREIAQKLPPHARGVYS